MIQEFLTHFLKSETGTYALVLSLITPLAWKIPSVLLSLFHWIKEKLIIDFQVHYADPTFNIFSDWLSKNSQYIKFNYRYKLQTKDIQVVDEFDLDDIAIEDKTKEWQFTPGYGNSLIKIPKQPWMLLRKTKEGDKQQVFAPTDIYYVYSFIWNKHKIMKLFDSIRISAKEDVNNYIYVSKKWGDFKKLSIIDKDYNDEIINNETLEIMNDMKNFFDNNDWYKKRGIPYKKGYILYGVPGTGKSKAVYIIANMLKKDLYVIKPEHIEEIDSVISSVPKGSIILLEEIDTVGVDRENESSGKNDSEKKKAVFSNFLNSLDGINSYTGSVLVATTNYIEKLDDAAIRSGRFDIKKEFMPLDKIMIEKVFRNFFDYNMGLTVNTESMTIADVNAVCSKNMHNPEKAAQEIGIELHDYVS